MEGNAINDDDDDNNNNNNNDDNNNDDDETGEKSGKCKGDEAGQSAGRKGRISREKSRFSSGVKRLVSSFFAREILLMDSYKHKAV